MTNFDFSWLTSDQIFMHFDPKESWAGMFPSRPQLGEDLKSLVEEAVASLEGLSSEDNARAQAALKEDPVPWKWVVDWWYCKDLVERIEPANEKFSKLTPILVRVTKNQEVNVYLREATQCYLFGFFQASTTLFRTALETGLKDCFDRKLRSSPEINLYDLIGQAVQKGILDGAVAYMAHEVREAANKVIHEEPITEGQAFDILVKTRKVLEELYVL